MPEMVSIARRAAGFCSATDQREGGSRCLALALATLVAASLPAGAASAQQGGRGSARIPDGRYSCQMWMGGSYVTLAAKMAGGTAGVATLARAGARITGVARSAGGITISYTTARGYAESMDCTPA